MFKTIISILGILAGILIFIYGWFLLAKWVGFVVLGLMVYLIFSVIGGEP